MLQGAGAGTEPAQRRPRGQEHGVARRRRWLVRAALVALLQTPAAGVRVRRLNLPRRYPPAQAPLRCFEENTDFTAHDVASAVGVEDPLECQALCRETTGCEFFTWYVIGKCYLKSSDQGRDARLGGTSGPKLCPGEALPLVKQARPLKATSRPKRSELTHKVAKGSASQGHRATTRAYPSSKMSRAYEEDYDVDDEEDLDDDDDDLGRFEENNFKRMSMMTGIVKRTTAAMKVDKGESNCGVKKNENACIAVDGCTWFGYAGKPNECSSPKSKSMPHPTEANVNKITGCHAWEPETYCQDIVALNAFDMRDFTHRSRGLTECDKKIASKFTITRSSGEEGNPFKRVAECRVWCGYDFSAQDTGETSTYCQVIPHQLNEVKGVHYWGLFMPNSYMEKHKVKSLCEVGEQQMKSQHMRTFLDSKIKLADLQRMVKNGFNTVRVPLGYWHLIDLPAGKTPTGPQKVQKGWAALQSIMTAKEYRKYIVKVFGLAAKTTPPLKVLLELRSAPGQQNANAVMGCNLGEGNFYFDAVDPWNNDLTVQAIEAMANLCNANVETCFGLELLSEPGYAYTTTTGRAISRVALRELYLRGIAAARKKLPKDMPILLFEWPEWLSWWSENHGLSYQKHGRMMFTTRLEDLWQYNYPDLDVGTNMSKVRDFANSVPFPVMQSKFTELSERDCCPDNMMTEWLVRQFSEHGIGSFASFADESGSEWYGFERAYEPWWDWDPPILNF